MLRRTFLLSAAAAGAVVTTRPETARAQALDPAALLKPGPLPEQAFGDPNAPVTVIEYASLTCHHCQNFHKTTWPSLKAKYVDTGKVRFVMREFPLDPLATAGFMLARCAGEGKWYPVVDLLYTSDTWAHAEKPVDALAQTMRQAGVTREQFDSCLRDEKLYQNVVETSRRGSQFGVSSTPTFFINGRKEVGALTLEQMEKIIEPLLQARAP